MDALKERILREGKNLGNGILKVDGFINHQVDPGLMDACGRELAARFADLRPTKVLTAEISGIAPALTTALALGIPVVYARKQKPITMPDQIFLTLAPSHTKGRVIELIVSPEYLGKGERVLIVDDFLASGQTIMGLVRLAQAAGASVVGVGAVIEKTFEGGRELLQRLDIPIESLAKIVDMSDGKIVFEGCIVESLNRGIDSAIQRFGDSAVLSMDAIAILDYGSQYTQLIARRLREARVYCEIFPHDAPAEQVMALRPRGFILSGGPNSVYDPGAPGLPEFVLRAGVPVLGICYGMQLLASALGGRVARSDRREYGRARLTVTGQASLLFGELTTDRFAGRPTTDDRRPETDQRPAASRPRPTTSHQPPITNFQIWMSHGDRVEVPPAGFRVTATSDASPIAAMEDPSRGLMGIQFHPEVAHTEHGREIVAGFLRVTGAKREWSPASIVEAAIGRIRAQVGRERVVAGVSGGVDSSVAAALVHRAVGDQLTCILVDTGLMRRGEPEQVAETFGGMLGAKLVAVNAAEAFLEALAGATEPERKRKIIGEKFIRTFEREAQRVGGARFLVQGTIYPDVIESNAATGKADRIKSHHNVGGLPSDLGFELVEPLRHLFKDEVRAVGIELGLPESLVWRQPFPGPGLAVRCLGEVTWERLETLRAADAIVTEELAAAGMLRRGSPSGGGETAQAFAVLLPVRSVGVMGDSRTYAETAVIRAVTTDDFMTADWARLPHDLLARLANRIVNTVPGINRVVYDITSKPPATIEWE